ncbi:hypothetical protein BRD00_05005 [Halobacteriales archaeon QS_8_69_26]|nr:MAG: hypothetical protein BRD00_05005 [Halobacteriales archaeon QS_8_69_26]
MAVHPSIRGARHGPTHDASHPSGVDETAPSRNRRDAGPPDGATGLTLSDGTVLVYEDERCGWVRADPVTPATGGR